MMIALLVIGWIACSIALAFFLGAMIDLAERRG